MWWCLLISDGGSVLILKAASQQYENPHHTLEVVHGNVLQYVTEGRGYRVITTDAFKLRKHYNPAVGITISYSLGECHL